MFQVAYSIFQGMCSFFRVCILWFRVCILCFRVCILYLKVYSMFQGVHSVFQDVFQGIYLFCISGCAFCVSGCTLFLRVCILVFQGVYSIFQGLCWCVAHVTMSGYTVNLLPQEAVNQAVAWLYEAHLSHPHSADVHLALGAACHGLLRAGHPSVGDLAAKLGQSWLATLQDQVWSVKIYSLTSCKYVVMSC